MNKRRVAVSAEALRDLGDIFEHIAEDSPVTARRVVEKLEDAALDLADNALHYQVILERSGVPVRRKVVGSYNILFWATEGSVGVLRFLHGKQRIKFPDD